MLQFWQVPKVDSGICSLTGSLKFRVGISTVIYAGTGIKNLRDHENLESKKA